ncbi:MAG: hypothetical protein L3J14_07860 [Flavobacteriaceae bacterium]|nr:hypothetical protein [Flavobacteriaceae bacterium]
MKTIMHKILWVALLCTTIIFAQKTERKINETFNVSKNAIVEINTRHTDVTIKTWNKNVVSIEGVWEVEGMTNEEANEYFEDWNFEALGNKNKVVVTSKNKNKHHLHNGLFDDMNFDFDLDSISYISNLFEGNFHFEMPPIPSTPELPEPFIAHLSEIQFDQEAYQKDKEGYMEKFEKRMEKWQEEFEKNIEPQMKEFERKMEKWQKENEPKMKEFENKMAKWEKENEKKMAKWEKKNEKKLEELEKRAKEMQGNMERSYVALLKSKKNETSKKYKIKKHLLIKVPKNAKVKLDGKFGTFDLPDDLNTVD